MRIKIWCSPTPTGGRYIPSGSLAALPSWSAATGAPQIRLHDLRHLHATLALAAGVAPRVLADRLGHSTTAVTTDTYQHVLPDLDHDAARRVAELVFADPPPTTERGSA
jgi:integrase